MSSKMAEVRGAVLEWYRRGHRELPWRQTRDAYAILVSEVMLQQTQVDRVIPRYHAFLARFPTLAALAAAARAEVIKEWSGLGYNLRAVRLHEIARQAVERYGGRLPQTVAELLTLKGIGRYTAGAVACFAFGQAAPVMDTNVRRVLGRIFAREAPAALEDDKAGWQLAEAALPAGAADSYDWNQALMDLGATVCVARSPRCLLCPAQGWCSARSESGDEPLLVAERRAGYAAAAVKREERFEGSRRWYRGRIVAALRELPAGGSLRLAAVGGQVKAGYGTSEGDERWLLDLVRALARDGLVVLSEDQLQVSLPE